jgi:hypothetical protein
MCIVALSLAAVPGAAAAGRSKRPSARRAAGVDPTTHPPPPPPPPPVPFTLKAAFWWRERVAAEPGGRERVSARRAHAWPPARALVGRQLTTNRPRFASAAAAARQGGRGGWAREREAGFLASLSLFVLLPNICWLYLLDPHSPHHRRRQPTPLDPRNARRPGWVATGAAGGGRRSGRAAAARPGRARADRHAHTRRPRGQSSPPLSSPRRPWRAASPRRRPRRAAPHPPLLAR